MAGKRVVEGATFITDRAAYRRGITAVDPSVENAVIPDLVTSGSPHGGVGLGQSDVNQYGQNAQFAFAVLVTGFASVTLQLWLNAPLEARYAQVAGSSSSSTSEPLPSTLEWVFVEEKTITRSSLWVVKDIPPGMYRVRVSAVTGTGEVHIREQHAA